MTRNVGLWIDHKHAFISWQDKEDVLEVPSNVEPRVGVLFDQTHGKEHQINDRFVKQLHAYYEKIIGAIHEAENIYIFGPGEAKRELEKTLRQHKDLRGRWVRVAAADRMTGNQIAARVREFFTRELVA